MPFLPDRAESTLYRSTKAIVRDHTESIIMCFPVDLLDVDMLLEASIGRAMAGKYTAPAK